MHRPAKRQAHSRAYAPNEFYGSGASPTGFYTLLNSKNASKSGRVLLTLVVTPPFGQADQGSVDRHHHQDASPSRDSALACSRAGLIHALAGVDLP